ncbi:MAG: ester cyclase [Bryobacteraceae bacterium]
MSNPSMSNPSMSNRNIVERALECFADPGRRSAYFDLYSEDAVLHGYEGVNPGIESIKQFYAGIWSAFPDARVNLEDVIELADKVVLRFVMTGTHRGPILGVAPTGKSIRLPGMTILRFQNGKCVERWSVADFLSVLAQLGGLPQSK